ncbi:hypothetical protein [uncultured Neglectibacter sp.]
MIQGEEAELLPEGIADTFFLVSNLDSSSRKRRALYEHGVLCFS